jgi:hypothetical protein
MATNPDQTPPADVRLLLRTHAEAGWLNHEVLPVVRELEQDRALLQEQLGAALAYLEVMWSESRKRADKTDATCAELELPHSNGDRRLHAKACGYHAALRRLRDSLAGRVALALSIDDCIR